MNEENQTRSDALTTASEVTPPPPPAPPIKVVRKRTRSDQDQRLQNDITQAAQDIAAIRADALILPKLVTLGYDNAKLQEGADLAALAQQSFTRRQEAMGAKEAATARLGVANETARIKFLDFRMVVRIALPNDAGAQKALGAVGKIPLDRQSFITLARAAYATASQPTYAEAMTRCGYDSAALQAALATADELEAALAGAADARQQAADATNSRNETVAALRTWRTSFHRAVAVARKR